ncbi:acidic proline-rich protein PRP25-like, partial [Zonotrichia leucophrys gambelii]
PQKTPPKPPPQTNSPLKKQPPPKQTDPKPPQGPPKTPPQG